jgi:hypothetical protein
MSLPERQGRLLRELFERTQQGQERAGFAVTDAPGGARVAFDNGAPGLTGLSMDDLRSLADRGFVELAPGRRGRLRGTVTSAGADYAAKNLKPMAGG